MCSIYAVDNSTELQFSLKNVCVCVCVCVCGQNVVCLLRASSLSLSIYLEVGMWVRIQMMPLVGWSFLVRRGRNGASQATESIVQLLWFWEWAYSRLRLSTNKVIHHSLEGSPCPMEMK